MTKVLIIGDICDDVYKFCAQRRLNPENSAPLLEINRTETHLGMAGNVHSNLETLGVKSTLHTAAHSVKTRFIDERTNTCLLRVDQDVVSEPLTLPDMTGYDALVICDYNKGTISSQFITEADSLEIPVFLDSKKAGLPRLERTILKVNAQEAALLKNKPKNLIVTLGARGCMWQNKLFSTPRVTLVDPCGAGDSFFAALCWKYLETKDIAHSIPYAAAAGAETVRHLGVYAPTKKEIYALTRQS